MCPYTLLTFSLPLALEIALVSLDLALNFPSIGNTNKKLHYVRFLFVVFIKKKEKEKEKNKKRF